MSALKWMMYIVLSILGLSLAIGAGAAILSIIGILTVIAAGITGIGFVAFCIKEWWEARSRSKTRP
jgi:hypothetical protein